ncbi:hypothetical protein GCM10027569_32330 [Flindersiella endophytica]
MNDDGGREAPAYGLALLFPVAFLGLTLLTRFGNAVYWGGLAGGAMLAALFVLPLLYAIPRGRTLWARHRGWLLAVQLVLTYAPLAVLGQHWINAGAGLLAGLVLLTLAAPGSWLLFGAIAVVEAVRIAVLGIPWDGPKAAFYTWMLVAPVVTGLAFFGLVRLGDLVVALRAARTELAELAVTAERQWSADRLRTAIGDQLEVVAGRTRAALTALPDSRDQARTQLAEVAGAARRALEQVRTAVAADQARPQADADPRLADASLAPRLARLTLAVVLGGQAVILTSNILVARGPGIAVAGAIVTIVVLVALQLQHSLGWRADARPRGWPLTLAAQTLLPFAWLPAYDWNVLTLAGIAAGSALLLLPRRWGWIVFACVVGGVGVAWGLPVLGIYYGIGNRSVYAVATDNATVLYQMGAAATAGIVVYGLSRLTDLTERVEAIRRELARAAVERERQRVAQDTHDLLGLGLSAVALKSDLATRLIGRDDARAGRELETILRLTGQARADLRAVTTGEGEVSLLNELEAARDVLESAGVDVEVRAELADRALPENIDPMLATVLREAVTNVLRHAEATRCEIELTLDEGDVRLRVANDGVRAESASTADSRQGGGHGLTNLAGRAAVVGGRLSAGVDAGRFELTVRAPLAPSASGGEDALAPGDPAYGVDEEVRRTVLDQEP